MQLSSVNSVSTLISETKNTIVFVIDSFSYRTIMRISSSTRFSLKIPRFVILFVFSHSYFVFQLLTFIITRVKNIFNFFLKQLLIIFFIRCIMGLSKKNWIFCGTPFAENWSNGSYRRIKYTNAYEKSVIYIQYTSIRQHGQYIHHVTKSFHVHYWRRTISILLITFETTIIRFTDIEAYNVFTILKKIIKKDGEKG